MIIQSCVLDWSTQCIFPTFMYRLLTELGFLSIQKPTLYSKLHTEWSFSMAIAVVWDSIAIGGRVSWFYTMNANVSWNHNSAC